MQFSLKGASTTKIIHFFVSTGCDPNDIVSMWDPESLIKSGTLRVTALVAAIGTRNVSSVKLLIENGADVNPARRPQVKRTPLQRAAEIGDLEILQLLMNHGAEVNAPAAEKGGGTALQLAAIAGFLPVTLMPLNHKAKVDGPSAKVGGRTALEGAAEHGRLHTVKVLLNAGAGLQGHDERQFVRATALANVNGHSAVCVMLEDYLRKLRKSDAGDALDMLVDDKDEGVYE